MRTKYRKLKTILKKNLRINSSKADFNKNLINDLGFCEWEVEYLLAKVENEFDVDLALTGSSNNLTFNNLLKNIQQGR